MSDENKKFVYDYKRACEDLKYYLSVHEGHGKCDDREDAIKTFCCRPPRYNPYRAEVVKEILGELEEYMKMAEESEKNGGTNEGKDTE